MKPQIILIFIVLTMFGCKPNQQNSQPEHIISDAIASELISEMQSGMDADSHQRLEKGVKQCAALWIKSDGTPDEFKTFIKEHFISDPKQLEETFLQLSGNFESLLGSFNKISVDLKMKIHTDRGEVTKYDEMFGAYDVGAHFTEDMFIGKIAFAVMLNFPAYTLDEKTKMGDGWTRQQWAYARMGDIFTSRVPAEINLKIAAVMSEADNYISNYNICMDQLRDNNNHALFPEGLKLISHWGLRDEIKSNYSRGDSGLARQQIIYQVMQRIIDQTIPEKVINSETYAWNPYSNTVWENNEQILIPEEPKTRYQILLNCFHAMKSADPYNPQSPTYIERKFSSEMEIPVEDVEKLFTEFISSPLMKQTGEFISRRLNRPLQPWDIWYDGFKSRSNIDEGQLDRVISSKYPDVRTFQAGLPDLLVRLGWSPDSAASICDKIDVDPSRGAGHAWGAAMKGDKAHLRTRFGKNGMDYKGFNIAIHEFGHNVEQTISLYNVDYYMLQGVPNTAFTEALAFIFQSKDLQLLGIKNDDSNQKDLEALDNLWSCYEIMGVSLVDIRVWKWLYEHPEATAAELQQQVTSIAKEVWNQYYAPVFQIQDSPILAVYSHMIDYPLYLSAYPIGHLIDFQIAGYLEDKSMSVEVYRMFKQGRIIPQLWMKQAVGMEISTKPTLDAAEKALTNLK